MKFDPDKTSAIVVSGNINDHLQVNIYFSNMHIDLAQRSRFNGYTIYVHLSSMVSVLKKYKY